MFSSDDVKSWRIPSCAEPCACCVVQKVEHKILTAVVRGTLLEALKPMCTDCTIRKDEFKVLAVFVRSKCGHVVIEADVRRPSVMWCWGWLWAIVLLDRCENGDRSYGENVSSCGEPSGLVVVCMCDVMVCYRI